MVKQWQIYFLNLNPVIGSEQAGTRPGIVVSSDLCNGLNQITIIPITSYKGYERIYPNEVLLKKDVSKLPRDSIVLAHQIRSVDKQRLANYVNTITDSETISRIQDAIKFQLEI